MAAIRLQDVRQLIEADRIWVDTVDDGLGNLSTVRYASALTVVVEGYVEVADGDTFKRGKDTWTVIGVNVNGGTQPGASYSVVTLTTAKVPLSTEVYVEPKPPPKPIGSHRM